MTIPARARYAGYRFPIEIISHAVWLYCRLPLGLRPAGTCFSDLESRNPPVI
jgi:transposase-like protein